MNYTNNNCIYSMTLIILFCFLIHTLFKKYIIKNIKKWVNVLI